VALRAELLDQEDPVIGQELIRVTDEDGAVEELRLHDYERLYALPGVYEQIVQQRLGCASPAQVAAMLGAAADELRWPRSEMRVVDVAAGNGISGEELVAAGMRPVLGTDIVPAARDAALRDRPDTYGAYLTLDLLSLSDDSVAQLRALRANAVTCVAPVGDAPGQVPTPGLLAIADLLTDDALVVYMHDPRIAADDVVTCELWRDRLGVEATELARERYLHRRTVTGGSYEMVGVVWRLRRQGGRRTSAARSSSGPQAQ
jgi:hypothetical protein